jgi:hypothetical protein
MYIYIDKVYIMQLSDSVWQAILELGFSQANNLRHRSFHAW